jgi:hypothetical protein
LTAGFFRSKIAENRILKLNIANSLIFQEKKEAVMAKITFIPEIIAEMISGVSKRCPICGKEKEEDDRGWICLDCFRQYWMKGVFAVKECIERTKAGVTEEEWDRLVSGFSEMISSPEKPSGATDDDLFYAVISKVNTPRHVVQMALACVRRKIEEERSKKERWESAISQVKEQFPEDVEINVFFFNAPRSEFKFEGRIIPLSVMRAACYAVIREREEERERRKKEEVEKYVMGFFSAPAPPSVEELVENPLPDSEMQSSGESATELPLPSPNPPGGQIVKEPEKTQKKKKEAIAGESSDSSGNQPKKRKGTRKKRGGDNS